MDQSTPLTLAQAAVALGISERTVRRRLDSGKLKGVKLVNSNGTQWLIDPADLPADLPAQPLGAVTEMAAMRADLDELVAAVRQPRRTASIATYIALYRNANGVCALCGQTVEPEDVSLDHIVPLSKGGAHAPENWQLAHRRCNSSKATRSIGRNALLGWDGEAPGAFLDANEAVAAIVAHILEEPIRQIREMTAKLEQARGIMEQRLALPPATEPNYGSWRTRFSRWLRGNWAPRAS